MAAPERRPAAMLFAELRNFTRLSEALQPDKVLGLANDFFALAGRGGVEHEADEVASVVVDAREEALVALDFVLDEAVDDAVDARPRGDARRSVVERGVDGAECVFVGDFVEVGVEGDGLDGVVFHGDDEEV